MLRKLDRAAIVLVSLGIGVPAVVPGWQIMTTGSVFGYALPHSLLGDRWPFPDFFAGGLLLLVVIGGGGIATAVVNVLSARLGPPVALAMGLVVMGWIVGELVFLTATMALTWIVLGGGVLLAALAAPYALAELRTLRTRKHVPVAGRQRGPQPG